MASKEATRRTLRDKRVLEIVLEAGGRGPEAGDLQGTSGVRGDEACIEGGVRREHAHLPEVQQGGEGIDERPQGEGPRTDTQGADAS